MFKHLPKTVLLILLALLSFNAGFSQVLSGAKRVANEKQKGVPFNPVDVQRSVLPASQQSAVRKTVTAFQTFDMPAGFYSALKQKGHAPVALTLPVNESENITLELVEVNILPEGNFVKTSAGETIAVDVRQYQGIIKGDEKSYAAISIFNNEIAGIFASSSGTYVVGRLRGNAAAGGRNFQVVYNEQSMAKPTGFSCGTPDVPPPANLLKGEEPAAPEATKCVRMYVEVEYDFMLHVGSVSATQNYLFTLMNNTANLYASAGATIFFSTPFIWTSADPYTASTSNDVLDQFAFYRRANNGGYYGAVGQLICYRNGTSEGLAGAINGLCSGISRERLAVMFGTSNLAGLPTYNRNAKVFAHEYGHLLGSQHTHACFWNGNNTRIDACGGNENGCAGNPGIPSAGTIMSYCDQVTSVNFGLGFGTQPGQRIVNTINAAPCLAFGDCGNQPCFTPQDLTATFQVPNWVISWAPVPGASSFTVEYKNVNSATWIAAPQVTGNSFNFGGLDPGVSFNFRVKANCVNAGTTNFTAPITVTGVAWCSLPSFLGATPATTSAVLTWSTNASASLIEYKPAGSGTWISAGIVSGTTTTISGLSPSTTYDWKVSPQCPYVTYPGYSTAQFTTLAVPCNAPTGLGTYNYTLMWGAVTGAVSYTVEYKIASETTWVVVSGVTNNYYEITSAASGTLYDWRVKTQCNPNASDYATAQFYTPGKCGSFSDLTNANITTNSATVSWILVVRGGLSSVDHIQLEYKATGTSTWTSVDLPNTTTSYNITGLTGGTTYEWRIRTVCYFTNLPGYYSSSSFTTLLDCTAPTGLFGQRIGCCGDVQLSWNAVPGATNYSLEVKRTTATDWTVIDNAYPYTSIEIGLATGSYNWRVKANCNGGSSGYSESAISSIVNTHCCEPLGKTAESRISVNPQPASKNLTIRYTSLTDERVVIAVADPSGRPQIRLTKMVVKGMNTIQLDVSKLKSGIYIVTAGSGIDAQKIKVVIQN